MKKIVLTLIIMASLLLTGCQVKESEYKYTEADLEKAYENGKIEAYEEINYTPDVAEGSDPYNEGYKYGFDEGAQEGYCDGYKDGYAEGYDDGKNYAPYDDVL